jgi:hypothetical protein
VAVYMHEPSAATVDLAPAPATLRIAIWASAAGILVLGIFPSTLLSVISFSASVFR